MTTVPLTEAKKKLLELVRNAQEQGKTYSLTRNGRPAAVLIGEEEYRSIKETLEVLNDKKEIQGILQGRKDIAAGKVDDLEELLERLQG